MNRLLICASFALAFAVLVHGECPAGTVTGPGTTEYCYSFSEDRANWTYAKQICAFQNGWLASSPNAFVNAFLTAQTGGDDHWLMGVGFKMLEGFFWDDDTPWSYANWAKGEPQLADGNWKGLALQASSGLWYAADEPVQKKYICQFPQVVTQQPAKPAPSGATTCDDGWVFVKTAKKCVKWFKQEIQWSEGLQQCRSQGGDLLSFHSQAEWDEVNRVVQFMTSRVAFGLYLITGSCAKKHCQPMWTDESPVDFLAWEKNYPETWSNVYGGCVYFIPDYTHDGRGLWHNEHCFLRSSYICQKAPHS